MTSKEKAKEIYQSFWKTTPQPCNDIEIKEGRYRGLMYQEWNKEWTTNTAKHQALICVDQIIKAINENRSQIPYMQMLRFYKEVEQELKAM